MGSKKKAAAQGDTVRNGTKFQHNGNVKSANGNGIRKGGGSSDESNHSEAKMVYKKLKKLKLNGKIKATSNNTTSAICTFLIIFISILIVTVAIIFSNPNLRTKLGQVINEYYNYQNSILDIDKNQTTVTEATKNYQNVNKNPDHINIQNNGQNINEKNNKNSEIKSDVNIYKNQDITNEDDFKIRDILDDTDKIYDKKGYEKARKKYEEILNKHPNSPRALFGLGKCLDKLAEKQKSNPLLQDSISTLEKVVRKNESPERLVLLAGDLLVKLLRFRGWTPKAVEICKYMVQQFPTNHTLKNDLGIMLLVAGKNKEATVYFKQILETQPDNGLAKVHLGFILKHEGRYEEAIGYLSEGIASKERGVIDGRFFFSLGDAYYRNSEPEKARKVYEEGAKLNVFLSADQRSLYNVPKLTARPLWTPEQTGYKDSIQLLKDNWKIIRDEGLANLDPQLGVFKEESEDLREAGDWKLFTLFKQGRRIKANCMKAPKTCALIEKIPAASTNKRGQVKFSVMHPGIHVWPHCGPTNSRLRAHIGLVVPEGPRIRVANDTRTWKEGEVMIFDDSFEHEVWHEGDSFRLVLIVDFWHPEITQQQRRSLSAL